MKINEEIAYLLGALRDATIDVRKRKNYEIKISQKNKEWLELIQEIFKKNFEKDGKISKYKENTWILRINSKKITKEIIKISEIIIPQDKWNTPSIIKKSSVKIQKAYVRGFYDAEGGLPRNPQNKQKYISLSQKNKESLEFVRNFILKLGMNPTNITFCGNVWEFRITRKNDIVNFIEKIGSWHPEKRKKLGLLKTVILSPNWRGSTQGVEAAVQLDPTPEILRGSTAE